MLDEVLVREERGVAADADEELAGIAIRRLRLQLLVGARAEKTVVVAETYLVALDGG